MERVPNGAKLILFLSSYSPLFLIVALRAHSAEHTLFGYTTPSVSTGGVELSFLSVIMLALTGLSLGFLYLMLRSRRTRQGQPDNIEQFRNRSDMFTEYLLVYIFPFIVFEFSDLYDVAAFFLLLLTVAAIVIRSNRLYVNPALVIFRYRVYEVETEFDRYLLLSKQPLREHPDTINTARISNGVYIATE